MGLHQNPRKLRDLYGSSVNHPFVACGMTKLKVEAIVSENGWFLAASVIALALLAYFPGISLILSRLPGK
jgi:TRAP-type C4-dicarboxylate transport system permease large subunit